MPAIFINIVKQITTKHIIFNIFINFFNKFHDVIAINSTFIAIDNICDVNIIIPKENEKDLEEIPDNVIKDIKFIFVDKYSDVYKLLFK